MKNKSKNIQQEIRLCENLIIEITERFIYDYFDDDDPYYFYVADEIGGVLNYGDYWLNFSDILTCYKLSITPEQLISWYDFCLSNYPINISLEKFILSPKERKEAEKKYLEELKERVKTVEKEFKKSIRRI